MVGQRSVDLVSRFRRVVGAVPRVFVVLCSRPLAHEGSVKMARAVGVQGSWPSASRLCRSSQANRGSVMEALAVFGIRNGLLFVL